MGAHGGAFANFVDRKKDDKAERREESYRKKEKGA